MGKSDSEHKPNQRFKSFYHLFGSLTKHKVRPTLYPIVSVILSYDSKRAITVTKKDDREFWVRQYDLETYDETFGMQIGGNTDSFIRTKEVEQNSTGTRYAIVFVDDGKFRLRVFDKGRRE